VYGVQTYSRYRYSTKQHIYQSQSTHNHTTTQPMLKPGELVQVTMWGVLKGCGWFLTTYSIPLLCTVLQHCSIALLQYKLVQDYIAILLIITALNCYRIELLRILFNLVSEPLTEVVGGRRMPELDSIDKSR
jgi:hypothetical protein